jgi:hypothetical protein
MEVAPNGSKTVYKILSRDGDAVLEYVDTVTTRYRWQVSSDSLRRNSPFFAALLDPNKFAEGRLFQEKAVRVKQQQQQSSAEQTADQAEGLPLVGLNVTRLTGKHRIEILELFLKVVLSSDGDEYQNARLAEEVGQQPISVVAGVLEIADLFSSSSIIHDALKRVGYVPSLKGKVSLLSFSSSLLKLSEDRIRQILYVALVLENQAVFQVLSHTLVLLGSTNWIDGLGVGKHGSHRWTYFPNGIEGKIYYCLTLNNLLTEYDRGAILQTTIYLEYSYRPTSPFSAGLWRVGRRYRASNSLFQNQHPHNGSSIKHAPNTMPLGVQQFKSM